MQKTESDEIDYVTVVCGSAPKCQWCGKFTKQYVMHQPHAEMWDAEPPEPELLCVRCATEERGVNAG